MEKSCENQREIIWEIHGNDLLRSWENHRKNLGTYGKIIGTS